MLKPGKCIDVGKHGLSFIWKMNEVIRKKMIWSGRVGLGVLNLTIYFDGEYYVNGNITDL